MMTSDYNTDQDSSVFQTLDEMLAQFKACQVFVQAVSGDATL